MSLKLEPVRVNCAACANDYSATYREAIGTECHASDWVRVRDAAKIGTATGITFLVTEASGKRYLKNMQTGWYFGDPAPTL